jgi:ATP-binding cassette subfamily B protein
MNSEKIYRRTISNYYRDAKKHPKLFYVSFLNPIGSILLNVGVPFYSGLALASVITNSGALQQNIIGLVIVGSLGLVCNRYGFVSLMKLQAVVSKDIGDELFNHILYRGLRFHTNVVGGKLVSDAFDYLRSFSTLLMASFTNGASFFITVVFGLAIVFTQSIQLGVFLILITSVTLIWAFLESKQRSKVRTIRHAATKRLVSHYSDTIVNAQTVKIFAAEEREKELNNSYGIDLMDLRIKDWSRAGISGTRRIGFLVATIVVLILFLNYIIGNDPSNIGVGIFAFTYTFSLILRLFDINTLTTQVEEALLNARPMTEILQQENEVRDAVNAPELLVSEGNINFNNVCFHYKDDNSEKDIFTELNLKIRSGEKIGLVGTSGGGKTTLTKILQRFEDIQSGEISIDNQNIASVSQSSLRSNIGYVPQEPLLFHRTIVENISYGKINAPKNEILTASKSSHSHEFIEKLPNKYETIVGERGVKLSGGQRQRVAIARAMLKDAPILVLDEATSALDSESEQLIQDALWKLMEGKTAIVIAHRLSTIQKMDRIIVLNNGKIIEDGSHRELIKKKNGHYAKLWKHQSGGFLQD